MTRVIAVEEFIELFWREAPWVLWLGAAVSQAPPACVPASKAIRAGILQELGRLEDPTQRQLIVRSLKAFAEAQAFLDKRPGVALGASRTMAFEAFLDEVRLHSGGFVPELIETLFSSDNRPNADHHAAVRLLARGGVDLIITTNFDECIETAAAQVALSLDVIVPVTGPFSCRSGRTLVKLHGTVSRLDSVAAGMGGLDARARSGEWRASLLDTIAHRNVLVVGYSFSDPVDITPVLRDAEASGTRFCWARRVKKREYRSPPVQVDLIPHDFDDPQLNLLLLLSTPGQTVPTAYGDRCDHEARVRAAASLTAARVGLSTGRRLETAAALLYWIEEGELASDLFAAARGAGAPIDDHSMARALARARRYSAAVRVFERILASGLPEDELARARMTLDVCMGAAWCARAGGRPALADRFYVRAAEALEVMGGTAALRGYLAEQYFRSLAGQRIRKAEMAWTRSGREQHLQTAERLLEQLATVPDIEPKSRSLQDLARAQIAIDRRRRSEAVRLLERAKAAIELWGDPHELAVCHRALASADPSRYGHLLQEEAAIARSRHRWLEWQKITLERLGLGRPSLLDPIRWRIRNAYIAFWDRGKELRRRATAAIRLN